MAYVGVLTSRIDGALAFLAARQLPSGELPTLFAPSPSLEHGRHLDSCVFAAAVAGCGLRLVERDQVAAGLLRRIRGFLMREMGDRGLWRYWTARSGKPIDPDLDDTALASFVIADVHPDIAGLSRAGMLANRDAHGRFQTWVRQPGAPNDVDSVVNANVVLSLGGGDEVTTVCAELNRLVADHDMGRSYRYYLSDVALLHAVARAYAHGVDALAPGVEALVDALLALQHDDGSFGTVLDTALATAALAYCADDHGESDGSAVDAAAVEAAALSILRTQSPDGGWPACAFYGGPEPPEPLSVWFGSEELTTAVCVEALALLAGHRPAAAAPALR